MCVSVVLSYHIHHRVSQFNLTNRANLVECLNSQNCTGFKNNIVYHVPFPFILHPRSTYHPTGRTCPLLPNTRHLPASDLICWNPTCWCASGRSFRYLTSVSSTTASTRCSGLRIYAILDISSAFCRRDTALTYLINRKCGNVDT